MTGELTHLSPATQAIVDLTGPERLAHLRGQWWINHPRAQAALDKLEAVLAHGPGRIRPPNLLIVGPTNNGKSMVAEKFRRLHPATPSACGGREITPVVVMQMPSEPSARRFYAALLTALNAPISFNVPGARLESYALELLRAVEARVLVIDELHNMLAGVHARRAEFLNTLRFLGNELRTPIVGLGTKQAQIAVRSDDQLENRFEPVPLPPWEDDLEFARLLTSFESALPLREPSGLGASPDLRSRVLRRSTGLIGEVAALLTSATAHALAHGTERIDRIVLDPATIAGRRSAAPSSRRRSRVFDDAEILSAPAQPRWPLHPPPMRFEQLDTYVRRLADAHGARLATFCRYGLGITFEEWTGFRDDPPPAVLARLSAGTGLSLRCLRNMTPRRSYARLRIAVRDLVRDHPEQVAELTAWARQQTPV